MINGIYYIKEPQTVPNLALGIITGMIVTIISAAIIMSLKILDSGLGDNAVRYGIGAALMMNILFSLNVGSVTIYLPILGQFETGGFPIGLGLITTVFNVFEAGDFYGIGHFITLMLAIILVSTSMMILAGSE